MDATPTPPQGVTQMLLSCGIIIIIFSLLYSLVLPVLHEISPSFVTALRSTR